MSVIVSCVTEYVYQVVNRYWTWYWYWYLLRYLMYCGMVALLMGYSAGVPLLYTNGIIQYKLLSVEYRSRMSNQIVEMPRYTSSPHCIIMSRPSAASAVLSIYHWLQSSMITTLRRQQTLQLYRISNWTLSYMSLLVWVGVIHSNIKDRAMGCGLTDAGLPAGLADCDEWTSQPESISVYMLPYYKAMKCNPPSGSNLYYIQPFWRTLLGSCSVHCSVHPSIRCLYDSA